MAFSFGGSAEKPRERLQHGCSQTLRVSEEEGEEGMELEVVVRQLMERSFAASVREDTWSFADHALVETLVALMLARIQPLPVEFYSEASLRGSTTNKRGCLVSHGRGTPSDSIRGKVRGRGEATSPTRRQKKKGETRGETLTVRDNTPSLLLS
jgi:hypothetical protein